MKPLALAYTLVLVLFIVAFHHGGAAAGLPTTSAGPAALTAMR